MRRNWTPPLLAALAATLLLPIGGYKVPVLGLEAASAMLALPVGLNVLHLLMTRRWPHWQSATATALMLLISSALLSSLASPSPASSVLQAVLMLLGWAFALTLADVAGRPDRLHLVLGAFVIAATVIAAMALPGAASLQAQSTASVVDNRLTGPFSQPNELGLFAAISLPVALALLARPGRLLLRTLWAACALVIAGALALSLSRGAWIGESVALVLLVAFAPRIRRLLGVAFVAMLVGGGAMLALGARSELGALLITRLQSLTQTTGTGNTEDHRTAFWQEALRQAGEHPLLGSGLNGFRWTASRTPSAVALDHPYHPHNQLLTLLTEQGIVGVVAGLAVAACLVALARRVIATRPATPAERTLRETSLGVLAALLVMAVHCLFDMPLRNPIVSFACWLLLGSALVVERLTPATTPRTTTLKEFAHEQAHQGPPSPVRT